MCIRDSPESHPSGLSLGMAGMHGHPVANRALMGADVIIAIGSRFSDRTTGNRQRFAADAKIIHIDLDAAEIDKAIETDVWLVGDASRVIEALSEAMKKKIADHSEWNKTLAEIRTKEPMPRHEYSGEIAPWQVPVSYTHLDVYKRQSWKRLKIWKRRTA